MVAMDQDCKGKDDFHAQTKARPTSAVLECTTANYSGSYPGWGSTITERPNGKLDISTIMKLCSFTLRAATGIKAV
eukprot:17935-Heterococcus_DN1.PRE.2